ncbi:uncharacterized protein METZ01_LOCUS395259, partial [marine metagenome]
MTEFKVRKSWELGTLEDGLTVDEYVRRTCIHTERMPIPDDDIS